MLDTFLGQRDPELFVADEKAHPQSFFAIAFGRETRVAAQAVANLFHHQPHFCRLLGQRLEHIAGFRHLHTQPFRHGQFSQQRGTPFGRGRQHSGTGEIDHRHDQLRHLLCVRFLLYMAEDHH